MNSIKLNNVTKKYGDFILDGVSFEIPKGFVTGLIGRNGSGKTTTLKAILSLISYEGEILIDNKPYKDTDLKNFGVIMYESFLSKDWNMSDINRAMGISYEKWNKDKFIKLLKRFSIPLDRKVKELSRGMKIKVMLSMGLSHDAKILILDEPTSGLDPEMRDEFTDIIREFVVDEENTVLFSTHITKDLENVADYIVFINEGKLVDSLPLSDFLEKYSVIKVKKEERLKIPKEIILGVKENNFGSEILIYTTSLHDLNEASITYQKDEIDIDKILILYEKGRNKNERSII